MIITYLKRANGQMDEQMLVSKRLRNRDISSGSVILDFKTRNVVKGSFESLLVPKDFDRVTDYYRRYYKQTIEQLELEYQNASTETHTD